MQTKFNSDIGSVAENYHGLHRTLGAELIAGCELNNQIFWN